MEQAVQVQDAVCLFSAAFLLAYNLMSNLGSQAQGEARLRQQRHPDGEVHLLVLRKTIKSITSTILHTTRTRMPRTCV